MGCASQTGLGNPSPEMLGNNGNLTKTIKAMFSEAIELYFKETEGLDYDIEKDEIYFGIEPSYMYEHLKIICIKRNKEGSYIENGYAHGAWGSDIARSGKAYLEYKNKCKFTRFIDKWHEKIYK
jgi:hypothetical protein